MPQTTTASLSREQRISAVCAGGCRAIAVIVPVAVAGLWAVGSWDLLALVRLIPPDILYDMQTGGPPELWQRVTGAAICLVPALLLSYGLLRARRSLAAFVRGDFFGADVVGGLRGYAAWTFWAAVAGVISVPVLSVAISFANPPGHKELSLDLSGAQVLNLLAAAILWVIASAMARAASLARENEQFV
ncbi:MAG: DUF2975 domain-containing protein [Alphaproteobacteria bacterium]|nr:DUF2975 domain-containing protein [Alphaproteobacteria bacterium]MBU1516080.1 DUF2975 domain-containing protein [Alphaproteobacteria bacterium]MBU2092705.1 DUF2975 domain-containing protein [Alphaproteobacteria bacterium]MBU2153770.1 DUF2975 domain-containing protein [Alphaproteobacteria bacterium]MBU2308398.1 DUF2975 domain-containing protein [Alphaproteobacteria bacterium]